MTIFMKIKGTDGNASAKDYENWIELESLTFGNSRPVFTKLGVVNNRGNSMTAFSEVEITKRLDKASNPLFDQVHSPASIDQVEIHVCHTGSSLTPYAKYIFNNVLISQHQTYVSSDDIPMEHVSLNYTKLSRTYVHSNGSPYTSGYDLETVQKT